MFKSLQRQQHHQQIQLQQQNNQVKYFTLETKPKEEVISNYCQQQQQQNQWRGCSTPTGNDLNNTGVSQVIQPANRRLVKMPLKDRIRFHQEVMNCRRILIESGRLRKSLEDNSNSSSKGVFSTLRKLYSGNNRKTDSPTNLNNNNLAVKNLAKEFETETFRQFPHSYWAYSKFPLESSLMVISDAEQESDSVNNFALILSYSGLTNEEEKQDESIYSAPRNEWTTSPAVNNNKIKDPIVLAQKMIERLVRKESSDIYKNEVFLQLIKQTTDHPDPNSRVNVKHWQLLALACSITYPTDRRILSYLHAHLRKCCLDSLNEEGQFAYFCLKNLQGTLETRGRKCAPSRTEVISTTNRRRIYARIHFLDGQFQAVEFDACATIFEVMEQIQLKIGLRNNAPGYALYQVLGQVCEQSIQPEEKVGDALSVWEKWHQENAKFLKQQGPPPQHYFIFKKHLMLDSFIDFSDRIERELLYHHFVYRIRVDKFPLSSELEAVMLAALKAQIDLGDFQENSQQDPYTMNNKTTMDYRQHMASLLPGRLVSVISPEEVITQHQSMKGMSCEAAKNSFFNLIKSWPLYRSTIFEVQQTYTYVWPKNLWLAIDSQGIHLLGVKTRNLLASCDYRSMIDYRPTHTSLMIVTLGRNCPAGNNNNVNDNSTFNNKTSKFLFLTHHAMQIASLIRDYTTVIAKEKGVGRRKSVEFDLQTKTCLPAPPPPPKAPPPMPPPRPSLSSRQQHMMMTQQHQQPQNHTGDVYGNIYGSVYGNRAVAGPQPAYTTFTGQNQRIMVSQQAFQPTHRRQKPMSITHFKPPPAIISETETV